MQKLNKVIFHIDLNSFYATCAMIKEPFLKNRVFVVSGRQNSTKGIILSASYKARSYGIKAAMPIDEALKLYPKLLIVPPEYSLYYKYSHKFFEYLHQYTDKMVKGSIDEAYMDVTSLINDKLSPYQLAVKIKNDLLLNYKLPVSIGIGDTLFYAKMGSDYKKPLGITEINSFNFKDYLLDLKISSMFGVGKKTAEVLNKIGINKIRDFYDLNNKEKILKYLTINQYTSLYDCIVGKSSNVVDTTKYLIPQSISKEKTLSYPVDIYDILKKHLLFCFEQVYKEVKDYEFYIKTVTIRIKYDNFKTKSKSKTFTEHTNDYLEIKGVLEDLFDETYTNNQPIRLIGCGVTNILLKNEVKKDINLFTYNKYEE